MGKWINCKNCGHEYHSSLNRCPECSTATPSFKNIAYIICTVLLCIVVGIGIYSGFTDDKIKSQTESKPISASVTEKTSSQNTSSKTPSSNEDTSNNSKTSTSQRTEASSKKDTSSVKAEKPSSSLVSDIHSVISSVPSSTQSSADSTGKDQTSTFPIGTVLEKNFAYTTLPKYYLEATYSISAALGYKGSFEDFAYKISDDQKAYGFTEIIKNSDGSATIAMPLNVDRIKFRTEFIQGGIELMETVKQLDFVTNIYGNNEYRDIFFELSREELTQEELANVILLGLYFLENQYYEIDSGNTCNVYLKTPDNIYSLLKFPDVLLN